MNQLFEPAQLGPISLRNRIIRSATNEHLSHADGAFSEAWAQAQETLAEGGVGLIITGHLTVDGRQRSDEGQPVLDAGANRALLADCARRVHEKGGRIAAQLSHSGLKANQAVNGIPPKAPADFTDGELAELTERFRTAALLCRDAGFDGVQVHNAHGYLLSNFLNPAENGRTDGYGGSLENRFRIIREILSAVRGACGTEFLLLVKADVDACGDLPGLLRLYQAAGVDGVEVSGLDFNCRAGQRQPFYLERLEAAREGTSLPLFPVGGVFDLTSAQKVLAAGFPFVSLCRGLICQPDLPRRLERGQTSACNACNACYSIYRSRPVRCVQHTMAIGQLSQVFGV